MALSGIKPFVHVSDGNGSPYVAAKLFVYAPGTTTPLAIYSDAGLSISMANPLTGVTGSDAAGNFPRFYLAAGTYKLRAEQSNGMLIWEYDNIDTGLSAGSGALPIASGGTGGTTATAARTNLDVPSNSELADLALDITGIQSTLQNIVSVPQGYLTPTSGVPVILTGVTAGTAVYYTPCGKGNLIPIWDGSQFNTVAFSELTLTLNSNHVASNIYDVFVFRDTGANIIGTGPAWNTATAGSGARGTGAGTTELTLTKGGLWTNAYAMTARNGATTYSVNANQGTYVGSLFIDATNGQITCHRAYGQSRKWSIWNAYNRVPLFLKCGDSTANWTYSTATWRESRGQTTNIITVFSGLAEEHYDLSFIQVTDPANAAAISSNAIGWNSTSSPSGQYGVTGLSTLTASVNGVANFMQVPALGINNVVAMENSLSAHATIYYGTEANMCLTAKWRA